MASAFISYSHYDEELRDLFEIHLAMLKREGKLTTWHDRRMVLSSGVDETISEYLLDADIIFALISPQFLASAYCYEKELLAAQERHDQGEARLVCVILRPCDWKSAPFATNLVAPKDGKPVTKWPSLDDGFLNVVEQVRVLLAGMENDGATFAATATPTNEARTQGIRSSNLWIRSEFTQAQLDTFVDEAFEYIKSFFENSLIELKSRHSDIDFRFKPSSSSFTVQIYKFGSEVARCRIFLESSHRSSPEIHYSDDLSSMGSGYNDLLSATSDETRMFLETSGFRSGVTGKLTFEGGAEHFWSNLISHLR